MPTYVVLTRLIPEAVKTPGELKRLAWERFEIVLAG